MTTLTVEKRESGKASAVRKSGLLPAVVYGRKEEATPISVPLKEFSKALAEAGESTVITLNGLGEPKEVLIKDIEYDAVTGTPTHADLYCLEKGQKVRVSVPLTFEGVSGAIKDLGGLLVKVLHELEVEAAAKDLPHEITVDLSALVALDSQIHVSDLKLPAGVEAIAEPEDVVALISVAEEEPADAPAMDISQIEMSVEKGKKEEEAAPEASE